MAESSNAAYVPPENLKERLAASYDIIAPKYNEWTVRHAGTRFTWLNRLFAQIPPPLAAETKVLELGAGAGLPTTKVLLDHDPHVRVVANDLSSHQLQLLKENLSAYGDRVTAAGGDMLGLDVPAASLDVVVGMYSIIHLPREEQSQLVRKISTWLKPGGLFLANFAEAEVEQNVRENWMGEGGWMYWSGWGVDGTVKMIEEGAGLEILEKDIVEDVVDAKFLWILAKKK